MTPREFITITTFMEPEAKGYDKDEWQDILKRFTPKLNELAEQDKKKLEDKKPNE